MSMSKHFLTHLAERPLLADGAMGTMLYARGFDFSECYDALNLSHPEVVLDIHRQYAAGASALPTSAWGIAVHQLPGHRDVSKTAKS